MTRKMRTGLLACLLAVFGAVFPAATWAEGLPVTLNPGVKGGRGGWISDRVQLPARPTPLDVVLDFVCRGPVSVNGSLYFYDESGTRIGTQFLWPSLKVTAREEWDQENHHAVNVPAGLIPPNARSTALYVSGFAERKAGDEPPLFDIVGCKIVTSTMPIGTRLANWFTAGEDVEFFAELPEGAVGIRGIVTDSDGKEVWRSDMKGNVWRWKAPPVGFYTATFAWLDAAGQATPCAGSAIRVCGHNVVDDVIWRTKLKEFFRTEQNFVVCATRPRTVEECPPAFGFNIGPMMSSAVEAKTEFGLIQLLGMHSFIRYHHFPWDQIEEKERGNYNWKRVDQAFAWAKEAGYGMDRILVNTFGTPRWLTSAPHADSKDWMTSPRYYAPKDMAPWHDFVKAFCQRYPDMKYFELWNEPHLPGFSIFWQKSSPAQFVELMKAGYQGAKEANPNIVVLMGGQGMRYQPFYEEYVKLGGVQWFDQVDTHCGYNMRHFRETEQRYGAEHKEYWEGEWHTVLYNCANPNPPNEEECAFRMLINMASFIHEGNHRRITGFGLQCGEHVPEAASFCAKLGGIQQVSGLFRSRPYLEPRLAAMALRTATDCFKGEIRHLGSWTFCEDGSQCMCVMESDAGRVAYAWCANEQMTSGWTPQFRSAIAGKRIVDWEGRVVKPGDMRPRRVYFVFNPDMSAVQKGVPLGQIDCIAYNYTLKPKIEKTGYGTTETPNWTSLSKTKGDLEAEFAPSLDKDAFHLDVKVKKGALKSVRFAIDVEGNGLLDDVVEVKATPNGTLIKPRTAAIRGDIPVEYSEANVPLKKSHMQITRDRDVTVWHIDMAMSDLYPFIYTPNRVIRFVLMLEGNRSAGIWGGGYGRIKKPQNFGELRPSGGRKVIATQADIQTAFQDATVTPGDVAKIKANSGNAAAGFVVNNLPIVPGSRVVGSAMVRGNATPGAVLWGGGKRIDTKIDAFGPEWKKITFSWDVPQHAQAVNVGFFTWRDAEAEFEFKDFQLVNE